MEAPAPLLLSAVTGNSQRLDGGAMFGNAPRALWQKWLPPDELGRVPLVCRALLVEQDDRKVLLETGIGVFFEPKYKERYGVVEDEHVLLASLTALGIDHTEIDAVVLSHLHFDHAGGLLSAFQAGKPPELLFPRAHYVVGETAFERAKSPHFRDRASFIPGMPELLERSGRLELVPDRAETSDVLGPNFRFWRSDGHTPGMLHTFVVGALAELVFCADLVPGVPWVHLPITMGYDRFPEHWIDEKRGLYERAMRDGTGLFFTHDPATSLAFLAKQADGRFSAARSFATLTRWDLDAVPLPS
jgi:glyoxylase-like metal-dependent hydrolase (beta-lactamase superfamily II)